MVSLRLYTVSQHVFVAHFEQSQHCRLLYMYTFADCFLLTGHGIDTLGISIDMFLWSAGWSRCWRYNLMVRIPKSRSRMGGNLEIQLTASHSWQRQVEPMRPANKHFVFFKGVWFADLCFSAMYDACPSSIWKLLNEIFSQWSPITVFTLFWSYSSLSPSILCSQFYLACSGSGDPIDLDCKFIFLQWHGTCYGTGVRGICVKAVIGACKGGAKAHKKRHFMDPLLVQRTGLGAGMPNR